MSKVQNILRGMSSVFDLTPSVNYTRNTKSDADNLAHDWFMVGSDLRSAIDKIKEELSLEGIQRRNDRAESDADELRAELQALQREHRQRLDDSLERLKSTFRK